MCMFYAELELVWWANKRHIERWLFRARARSANYFITTTALVVDCIRNREVASADLIAFFVSLDCSWFSAIFSPLIVCGRLA